MYSFLHITKSEIDLPEKTDPYSQKVYETAKENLDAFISRNVLFRENYTFKTSKYRASSSYFSLDGFIIMQKGIWATAVKERSLEEWHQEWRNSTKSLKDHIKSTKTELIEILKNLPNE